jgi:hypothetical protein
MQGSANAESCSRTSANTQPNLTSPLHMQITLEIDDTTASLLATLSENGSVPEILETLIDHAAQGVYRPGAWEREWLCQIFGDDFVDKLEPGDPFGRTGRNSQLLSKTQDPVMIQTDATPRHIGYSRSDTSRNRNTIQPRQSDGCRSPGRIHGTRQR